MTAEGHRPVCLDITRLVQRADAGPLTGIDRVEQAYLAALCTSARQPWFLCRTTFGWLVADRNGGQALLDWTSGGHPPPSRVSGRLLARRRRAPAVEAALRRHSRCILSQHGLMRWLPDVAPGATWLSVGHFNLNEPLLRRVSDRGLKIAAMIHDTIPLDHPEWSGHDAPLRFGKMLAAAARYASVILCPSRAAEVDIRRHLGAVDGVPPIHAVHLGVAPAPAAPDLLPPGLDLTPPYFVALGTIEPRKDHRLLLDIWRGFCETLAESAIPRLFICGRRGWGNEDVFARLKSDAAVGTHVHEFPNLTDGAISALLAGSAGLLAPSRAEGFGLPAAEAAALGCPVLATDLPVTREVLVDWPIYLPAGDAALWSHAILSAARPQRRTPENLPGWTEHFNCVFSLI